MADTKTTKAPKDDGRYHDNPKRSASEAASRAKEIRGNEADFRIWGADKGYLREMERDASRYDAEAKRKTRSGKRKKARSSSR